MKFKGNIYEILDSDTGTKITKITQNLKAKTSVANFTNRLFVKKFQL